MFLRVKLSQCREKTVSLPMASPLKCANLSSRSLAIQRAPSRQMRRRLTYAKLGLSSHKCTGLHGVSATRATLDRLVPLIAAEMDRWQTADPRGDAPDKTLGPMMVHKAQTAIEGVARAKAAGLRGVREGGRVPGEDRQNAEAVEPALIDGVNPHTTLKHDWDGK